MNTNQYIQTPRTASKGGTRGYGKAAWATTQFMREHGLVPAHRSPNIVLRASVLAKYIYDYRGQPCGHLGKGHAKALVIEFAKSLAGVPAPVAKKPAQPRAILVPAKTPSSSRSDFYWSEEWRRVRYAALRKSLGVCELCAAAPTPGHPLHVDHIKPRSKFPELELDPENLQVLCEDCNLGKSNTDSIDWRRKAAG